MYYLVQMVLIIGRGVDEMVRLPYNVTLSCHPILTSLPSWNFCVAAQKSVGTFSRIDTTS